jgi:hypothetical protein
VVASSLKLISTDVNVGEAKAALLATKLALSINASHLILEGDSLITILALTKPNLITDGRLNQLPGILISILLEFQLRRLLKFTGQLFKELVYLRERLQFLAV